MRRAGGHGWTPRACAEQGLRSAMNARHGGRAGSELHGRMLAMTFGCPGPNPVHRIHQRARQRMHRTPDSSPFALFAPPLQARMRYVMVETRAQALEDFVLDAKQSIEH